MAFKFPSWLDITSQCKKQKLSLWQCPQFIFLVIGLIIIISLILGYFITSRIIADPLLVALIIIILATILLLLDFIITNSFERLAEIAKMRADFVTIVTHQLRAPLSNLKWTIELLEKEIKNVSQKTREDFAILKENSERLTELVADLVITSQIEEGSLSLKPEFFDLPDLIKKTTDEFKSFAKACNVELELLFSHDFPKVFADPLKTKQVLEILIDNAIKYNKKGGKVKINLFIRQKKQILFQIEDEGIGILKEEQKYIFKKFFRGENALKKQPTGSGLGLFIAKSIINKSKGKIGFYSPEGKGSTFWFTLPISKNS